MTHSKKGSWGFLKHFYSQLPQNEDLRKLRGLMSSCQFDPGVAGHTHKAHHLALKGLQAMQDCVAEVHFAHRHCGHTCLFSRVLGRVVLCKGELPRMKVLVLFELF